MNSGLRVVLPGGTGQIGTMLARHFHRLGHRVTVFGRKAQTVPWNFVVWDGKTRGAWTAELEGADLVVNLSGRSVNCRYTAANRREIMDSRVLSTKVLGEAIAGLNSPPRLWMNMSTATIYRHALDHPMDETSGELGGNERDVPDSWAFSIDVATTWERAFFSSPTPLTRKLALRSAMVMSPDHGGVFDELLRFVRFGVGGKAASGLQFISWIHDMDFIRSLEFLAGHEEFEGPVNLCSPNPLSNGEFMKALRQAWGARLGLASPRWLLEAAAVFLRTETELILKSRRVVPGRLVEAGFKFQFPDWPQAAKELVARWKDETAEGKHNSTHSTVSPGPARQSF
jgi:uncharacterized protein